MTKITVGTIVRIKSDSVLYNAGETAIVEKIRVGASACLWLEIISGAYAEAYGGDKEWARPDEVEIL